MSYSQCYYHIVFRTKDSTPTITPEYEHEFYNHIAGFTRNKSGMLVKGNGMSDHVHLLVSLLANIAPSDFVRDLKTSSSFWMKDEDRKFPDFEGWAIGYAILSCGHLEKDKIIDYIQNQKRHHSNMTFMNEIKNIFQQYHIEVNEEYFDRNI